MARERRSKKEIIIDKIGAIDEKIKSYSDKIDELNTQKTTLQQDLDDINEAERQAEEAENMKAIMDLMKKKGMSASDLKSIIENKEV